MASLVAIFAMGYPEAFEARDEERDTRGLISMATISSFSSGETANCTLHPPEKLPMARIMRMAMSRMRWNVRSERVMAGAMVIESPVWIPIGSRFSMVVMMITLSFLSRKSSSSNSFQPISALSMSTSWMGEASRPRWSRSSNLSLSYTSEAPVPPRVNEGRMHSGKPNS